MTDAEHGGERDLAPVVPLFARRREPDADETSERPATRRDDAAHEQPADVVPLFAGRPSARTDASPADERPSPESEDWHTTWRDLGARERRIAPLPEITTAVRDGVRFVEVGDRGDDVPEDEAPDEAVEAAEARLMKTLRSRALSVSEARARLRQDDVPPEIADDVLVRLERLGALDDAALAEQLVHVGTSRKNQGRRAIAQTLQARGIPRDLVDAVLEDLPDDDAERALEFARSKAKTLARYDDDTALRRLVGQLGRRGFNGSLAMSSARRALDEERRGGRSGVRFS